MAVRQNALLTADDYRSLPEGGPRYELIQGELAVAPAPNRYHQKISGNLFYVLRRYLEIHPIGEVYAAPFDVYLSVHDVVQPDLLYVANQRHSVLNDAGAAGAPSLVVEILSPGTEGLDRTTKKRIYAIHGVEELWLVDPSTKTIESYLLQQNPEQPVLTASTTQPLTSPCFPHLVINVEEVF